LGFEFLPAVNDASTELGAVPGSDHHRIAEVKLEFFVRLTVLRVGVGGVVSKNDTLRNQATYSFEHVVVR
jgi:hypothetical protein